MRVREPTRPPFLPCTNGAGTPSPTRKGEAADQVQYYAEQTNGHQELPDVSADPETSLHPLFGPSAGLSPHGP